CQCDTLGSRGVSCDDNGICSCLSNFIGTKCNQCAPERYNYPLCEECNCNPEGVTQDFFAMEAASQPHKVPFVDARNAFLAAYATPASHYSGTSKCGTP
ncbi:Uncharacterized protein FKW44_021362, partial [Caligus rogercresseyi]